MIYHDPNPYKVKRTNQTAMPAENQDAPLRKVQGPRTPAVLNAQDNAQPVRTTEPQGFSQKLIKPSTGMATFGSSQQGTKFAPLTGTTDEGTAAVERVVSNWKQQPPMPKESPRTGFGLGVKKMNTFGGNPTGTFGAGESIPQSRPAALSGDNNSGSTGQGFGQPISMQKYLSVVAPETQKKNPAQVYLNLAQGRSPLDNGDGTTAELPVSAAQPMSVSEPASSAPAYYEYGTGNQTASPYDKSYNDLLSELNGQYGGDFLGYDTSGLSQDEKAIYDSRNNILSDIGRSRDQYKYQTSELERQRYQQLQQAYINKVLAEKYLPTQLKAAGLGGLGVSQTTLAQMQNDYQNNLANINAGVSSETRRLFQDYLDSTREREMLGKDEVRELERTRDENLAIDANDYLSQKIQMFSNQGATMDDLEKLDDYLQQKKKYLKESEYAVWNDQIKQMQKSVGQTSIDYIEKRIAELSSYAKAQENNLMKSPVSQEEFYRRSVFNRFLYKQSLKTIVDLAFDKGEISERQKKEFLNAIEKEFGDVDVATY